ncbi:MAG TPA: TolC family protein [Candidatus Acidoferrales bacterium]|nr:TolC family protein [Candidatus Acidoferrales bacterium]
MRISIANKFLGASAVLVLSGCAAQRYKPAPIVPAVSASRLESRTLSDVGLRSFIEENLGQPIATWPPSSWNLQTLSLAALYFNPTLDSARARVEEADAAIVTAGGRPNPTFDISPGVPSPYLFSLDLLFPIETAGKRGHRIQSASSLMQAAQLDLADSAWKVRSGVRTALLDYFLASRSVDLLRAEQDLRTTQVRLLQERLTSGEIPRVDLDTAQIAAAQTQLAATTAQNQITEARVAIAAAIGLPASAMSTVNFGWDDMDSPPDAASISAQQIERDAVLNRMDVRRALAQYTAAEANLQLEIAKQYPDVQIGPGYSYEEQHNYFTTGLSVTLPIFNRNQGPIAEAEAKRKEAAASVREAQAQVIAQSGQALAAYTAAMKELSESDQLLRTLQNTRLQMTERAAQVGEEDSVAVNGVQIESNALSLSRLDALVRAQTALGQLEDAVQRPLDPGDAFPEMQKLIETRKEDNQ